MKVEEDKNVIGGMRRKKETKGEGILVRRFWSKHNFTQVQTKATQKREERAYKYKYEVSVSEDAKCRRSHLKINYHQNTSSHLTHQQRCLSLFFFFSLPHSFSVSLYRTRRRSSGETARRKRKKKKTTNLTKTH